MEQRRYACDGCRRRRIRCDASQPCHQCTRSGITCTYGSVASRQSATSYARNLEQQVADLQHQLQALATSAGQSNAETSFQSQQSDFNLLIAPGDDLVLQHNNGKKVYRFSAALNVLKTIADMIAGDRTANPAGRALVEVLESPLDLPVQAPMDWLNALLPSRERIWDKISYAIEIALIGLDCIDRVSLKSRLDALLDRMDNHLTQEDKPLLSLVYALLAIGELYEGIPVGRQPVDYADARPLCGLSYFRASRCIVRDEHEHINLESLTAMLLHSRYLLSTSTFSDAHAALSVAISAAMQMGIHLDDSFLQDSFSETELYDRRRVLASMIVLETCIAFPLGMPRVLRTADPKQVLGLGKEDLVDEGEALIAREPTTPEAETILNQKLVRIYSKILDQQYGRSAEVRPSLDWMSEVEVELKEWEQHLPPLTQHFATPRLLQGQLNLRLHLAGIYIILTAPCLHHLGRDRTWPAWNLEGYEYASMCIRAASESVFLMETLQVNGLLAGYHWLNNYILAWAAIVLSYFVIHSRTRVTITESKTAALLANQMLGKLGETSSSAKRIHQCIAPYMDMVVAITE